MAMRDDNTKSREVRCVSASRFGPNRLCHVAAIDETANDAKTAVGFRIARFIQQAEVMLA